MKSDEFKSLVGDIGKCDKCLHLLSKSLINFYSTDMAFLVPSIWTDWLNHLDADVMIIGQDWGPYKDMELLYKRYKNGESWEYLIDEEKSLTKKNLFKFLKMTNKEMDESKIFITNAIMCARNGTNYRGNNIDLKYSTCACSSFLRRQIEIVQPKVIVTLGYYPLLALSKIYGFPLESNLTKSIEKYPIIKLDNYIIVPVFHPAAQISLESQIKQYKRIWDNI